MRGLKRIKTQKWKRFWIFHLPSCTGRKKNSCVESGNKMDFLFLCSLAQLGGQAGSYPSLLHPSWIVFDMTARCPHRWILLLGSWLALSAEAGWQPLSHWCSLTPAGCATVTLSAKRKENTLYIMMPWCNLCFRADGRKYAAFWPLPEKCNLKTECNGVIKRQRLQIGGRKMMKHSNGIVSWRRREIMATLTTLMCTPQWQ